VVETYIFVALPSELGVRSGKIVGHEPAGVVTQTGAASGELKVSDRVR
jgi:threonine dehydrogenase-like Zn-dependent dehydrogenase